jgi:predicted oxidoreductase
MERVELGQGVSFSRIIYGMWRIADHADTSPGHVASKIEACLDQGISTFDQADIYGGYTAEGVLGAALKAQPHLRKKMEIVSKCGIVIPSVRYPDCTSKHYNTSAGHIVRAVDRTLSDLGTDYIDLLLIHRPDPFMDHHDTGAALDGLVAAGKIRATGVSNFRPWDWELLQAGTGTPLAANQIELSLQALDPFTNGDLAFHQRLKTPVMAWSPLGGGALMTGRSPLTDALDAIAASQGVDRAAVAVAFLLAHPARILPVLGTNTLSRIRTLSDAAGVVLSREDWFRLYTLAQGREVP